MDKGLVLLSAWEYGVVDVFICGVSPAGAGERLPVIPSPRSGGMKRFAGDGRSGSIRGCGLAVSGVMTCTIRADREPCAHAARGERCRARTWWSRSP